MTLSIDQLRNGLDVDKDLVFAEQPTNPDMRESTSIWMFDEEGRFGFPRMGIEAEASSWGDRMFQGNFAFADGRILDGAGRGPAPSPLGPDGRPTVLGAGSLVFTCIEPFRRWKMTFDGPAVEGRLSEQIANALDRGKQTHVRLDVEMEMVTPAWSQTSQAETATLEDSFMGVGYRFEHLFRAQGTFQANGQSFAFNATGLRIKRQSVRMLEGFNGHVWQSAVFPDGRAFGYITYPPREDGSETYNEGYVFQDGRMLPAKIVEAPWLRRIGSAPDDVGCVIESELGRTRIEGSTTLSTFSVGNPHMVGLNLQQSGALYRWDGQSAYGMIERSSRAELTTIE